MLLHTITLWASENREGIVSVFWKSHGLCTRKKEVLWVGGRERVVLAKAVKIVTFGIHYSQKNPYAGAKHERERSGESEVTSESTGCFLLGGSKQWLKISGKFSSSQFSYNNFYTLCRKFKIMRVLNNCWKTLRGDQVQGEAIGNLTLHSGDHVAITCMWFPPRARAHPADPGMLLKQKFTGTWE